MDGKEMNTKADDSEEGKKKLQFDPGDSGGLDPGDSGGLQGKIEQRPNEEQDKDFATSERKRRRKPSEEETTLPRKKRGPGRPRGSRDRTKRKVLKKKDVEDRDEKIKRLQTEIIQLRQKEKQRENLECLLEQAKQIQDAVIQILSPLIGAHTSPADQLLTNHVEGAHTSPADQLLTNHVEGTSIERYLDDITGLNFSEWQ